MIETEGKVELPQMKLCNNFLDQTALLYLELNLFGELNFAAENTYLELQFLLKQTQVPFVTKVSKSPTY